MSVQGIKEQLAALPRNEQDEVIAYLFRVPHAGSNDSTNLGVASFHYPANLDPLNNNPVGFRLDLPEAFFPISAGVYRPARPGQKGKV